MSKNKRLEPLSKVEGKYFQELVDASNRYQAALKEAAQYDFAIKRMEEDRTKIQKGEISPPFHMTVIPNVLTREVTDKKEILAVFDEQLKTYKGMLKGLNGQIQHRYDEFVESGKRNAMFLSNRFKSESIKAIAPDRRTAKAEEEVLFEAEFEELAKDPDVQKEYVKAKKEAVKRNVSRKQ